MKTAIEKLEALFYNEADPTINSSSWVIHEKALKKIILATKEIEKDQLIKAYNDGYKACDLDEALEINKTMFNGEEYYIDNYKPETI